MTLYSAHSESRAAVGGSGSAITLDSTMSCYVDTARPYPEAGLRYSEFCHLLADSRDELHDLAGQLGIPRRLFQDHPWRWHYDVPAHLRPRAVELGAREVEMHQVGALLRHRRADVLQGRL